MTELWKTTFIFMVVIIIGCCRSTKIYLKQVRPVKFFGEYWEKGGNCGAPWMKFNGISGKYWSISNFYKKPVPGHSCHLLSDYYKLPSTKINSVYINVVGGGNYCAYVDDKYGDMCDQNYTLMTYKGHERGDMATDRTVVSRYGSVSNVPTVINKVSSASYTYNDSFSVNVFGKSALRLLFYARYYWGNLHDVYLYYYKCLASEEELVKFPSVNAPSEHDKPMKVSGRCAPNSVPKSKKLYLECWYNGTSTMYGKCICDKGYEFDGKICTECKGNTFKPNVGNFDRCISCGRNALAVQKRSCVCYQGYYREIGKETQDGADCYSPPSAPTLISIRNITKNSGIVELGESSVGTIILNCSEKTCSQSSMIRKVSSTVFSITGLKSLNQYFFKAYVANSVTKLTGHANYMLFNFTTKAEDGRGTGGTNFATSASVGVAVAVAVVAAAVIVVVFLKCRHRKDATSAEELVDHSNGEGGVLMSKCGSSEAIESSHDAQVCVADHIYDYIDPKTITVGLVGENPLYSNAQNNSQYEVPDICNEENTYDRLQSS